MASPRQAELQLGHMCNNRCVFCVSGQETALGRARPTEITPILEQLQTIRQGGAQILTLLGGEPTLQPGFLEIVREATRLDFDEIVIFTNGVKTARLTFVDEMIAVGKNKLSWRLSFQGATKEAHEATTQKPGSFDRLVATLKNLSLRKQRVSVNMCVVQSNFSTIVYFADLLLPYGVHQLHLDMMRPLDAGHRTEEELAATLPHYPDLAAPLTQMVERFPPSFDLNIGNLPFCIAPSLAPWIHHDGEPTEMVAANGDHRFSRPLDKYLTKRRDKIFLPSCSACAFAPRCSGVFETYARIHGTDALQPISLPLLKHIDPERRFLSLHLRMHLLQWSPPSPLCHRIHTKDDHELIVHIESPDTLLEIALRSPGGGVASTEELSLHVLSQSGDLTQRTAALQSLWTHLQQFAPPLHPLGDDATQPLAPSVHRRLSRLRQHAPFGQLQWTALHVLEQGTKVEVRLEGPAGELAILWLQEQGKPSGGYRIEAGEISDALVSGLRKAITALSGSEQIQQRPNSRRRQSIGRI